MILVTGGAGYIGSHTLIELANANYDFVVYDNFYNSSQESIKQVEKIIDKGILFEQGDIRDKERLQKVFKKYNIDSVIHFAGLKAVGESMEQPLKYYDNNVNGIIMLLDTMKQYNCKKIVFSSSATVYNEKDTQNYIPLNENDTIGDTKNPYGMTKYICEQILQDIYKSDNNWKIVILRYFNPIGAHGSGLIGENPNGIPNNLMPYISQVSVGKLKYLNIFGDDYNTKDGTGVRDYIHIMDLANAHIKSLDYINSYKFNPKLNIFNIGTGIGYSVLDIIKAYEQVNDVKIAYKIVNRRDGDIDKYYANSNLANNILGWSATKDINDMCRDSFRWQNNQVNNN